jgi:oxepin-CoA hydrolase/3-oxo-5,6-dehydrosuberyl-CoA semialdehyde dehydrogenase
VALTAKQITPRATEEYGEVCWDAVIVNQRDEVVATYDVLTLVAKSSYVAESPLSAMASTSSAS